jgi:hypothetical protein
MLKTIAFEKYKSEQMCVLRNICGVECKAGALLFNATKAGAFAEPRKKE